MPRLPGPAYRVETARLRLRCFEPADVALVHEAVCSSLLHLQPWMSWARQEPLDPEQRLELLRTRRGHFDLGGDYAYGLFDKAGARMLGGAGLSLRGAVDERELGYWIRADSLRQGLATEAAAALVRVAFELEELANLDIRLDPNNLASANVALKLGFLGPSLDPEGEPTPEGERRTMHLYSMPRVLYASSPLRALALEAYDVLGRRLL
jgi:RimJ/RimL family protein N-acetyltransferase